MAFDDENFGALFEASATTKKQVSKRLRVGERVEGTIVVRTEEWLFVDVGAKSEARLDRASADKSYGRTVAVGERIRAVVADTSDPGGPILAVSLGRDRVDAQTLRMAHATGLPVEGTVCGAIKGGLEVQLGSSRGFCPASQIDLAFVQAPEGFVGQTHFFKVLELRERGRQIIVSRRAILEDAQSDRARELLARIEPGIDLDGIVQSVHPYGAFVDLGGVTGLLHVSELSHGRVARPEDAVRVGEQVRVRVLEVQPAASGAPKDYKISLSLRALMPAPEPRATEVDRVIEGVVHKVEPFGVFVDTELGRGLVPMAELGLPPAADPRRSFPVGAKVEVVVVYQDPGSGRLRLSVRGVATAMERRNYREFSGATAEGRGLGSLGDLLKGVRLELPTDGAAKRSGTRSRR